MGNAVCGDGLVWEAELSLVVDHRVQEIVQSDVSLNAVVSRDNIGGIVGVESSNWLADVFAGAF